MIYRGIGTYKRFKLYEVEDENAEITGNVGTRYCRSAVYVFDIRALPNKDEPIKVCIGNNRIERAKKYIDQIISNDLDRKMASARLKAEQKAMSNEAEMGKADFLKA